MGAEFWDMSGIADHRGDGALVVALIDHWDDERREGGPARLSLAAPWAVVAADAAFPEDEVTIPDVSIPAQLEKLWGLRRETIVAADLPDDAPHLVLTLSNRARVFVWGGECGHLEPWGVQFGAERKFQLVCQGWQVAIWVPDDFLAAKM